MKKMEQHKDASSLLASELEMYTPVQYVVKKNLHVQNSLSST